MDMLLNTVRMMDYDQAKEYLEGDTNSLKEKLAVGLINPEDYKNLNITPNSNLKITSKFGEVIIRVEQDEDIPRGMINMPVSIWANQITGIENNELMYKNIRVNVEVTKESILNLTELLKLIKEK